MPAIKLSNWIILATGLALSVLGIVLLVMGGGRAPEKPGLPANRAEFLAAGAELVKQYNCNYCHRTEPPADHPSDRANCQQCHQFHNRVENLAPPLAHVAERRTEEWIRRYLRYPYPVRTNSADRMPDLGLSDFEIEVLTGYLVASARLDELPSYTPKREEVADATRLARGKALWDRYACGTCHSLGEHEAKPQYGPGGAAVVPAVVFAPPLDIAWTRTRSEWIAAAIRDPGKWLPFSGMTVEGITDEDAEELAWYVTNAIATPAVTATHNDVMGILAASCNSCHYGPRENASPATNPEGGAGWLGLWGEPRRLDFTTYEGLRRGAVDDLGRPRPAVVPYAENSPLLAHIQGWKQPRMPFGTDPLQPQQIDTIRRWIMAGAPGPEVTDIPQPPPLPFGD